MTALANWLGDKPEVCIASHLLNRGFCKAWTAAEPAAPQAAIIQPDPCPAELVGFGSDPELLHQLLSLVHAWTSVEVGQPVAPQLGARLEQSGVAVRAYDDVLFAAPGPVPRIDHPLVRRLRPTDARAVEQFGRVNAGSWFGDTPALLREGFAAGAVSGGELVALAFSAAITQRHAAIAAFTLESGRGKGLARAVVSLAGRAAERHGLVPVWKCGAGNVPALAIARRLGLTECCRRTCLIRKH